MTSPLTDDAIDTTTSSAAVRDTAEAGTAAAPGASAGPPQAWVERVEELYISHGLPPLLMDPAGAELVDGRWQLHPWRRLEDVTALLAWGRHLDKPVSIWQHHTTRDVLIYGVIAGQPTRLVSSTHRRADRIGVDVGNLAAIKVTALERLAQQEQRDRAGEVGGVQLLAWQAAQRHADDPLSRPLPAAAPATVDVAPLDLPDTTGAT